MNRPHIPEPLRRLVVERAQGRCEYCLIHQEDTPLAHHADHIIALKHGGLNSLDNLALACVECNRRKGSDLTSIDPHDGTVVQLFNPRTQPWSDHFALAAARVVGKTPTGRATVVLLRINDHLRMAQRQALIGAGRYP